MDYTNAIPQTGSKQAVQQSYQGQNQTQYGVSSGYKDIQNAVEQIVNTVDNLRSSLGVSIPQMDQSGGVPEVPTLATQLRALALRLGSANVELGEVLMHLNS